jgi:hypothetical protein
MNGEAEEEICQVSYSYFQFLPSSNILIALREQTMVL